MDWVRFVTSHFLHTPVNSTRPTCDAPMCGIVHWTRQVQALASQMSILSGERTSVHVFSPCVDSSLAAALSSTGGGSRVQVHAKHANELVRSVQAMHKLTTQRFHCSGLPLTKNEPPGTDNCDWARPNVFMLLRWEIMSMTDARVVVYLDLDVEVLPRWSLLLLQTDAGTRLERRHSFDDAPLAQVAKDWLELLRCGRFQRACQVESLSFRRDPWQLPETASAERRRHAC